MALSSASEAGFRFQRDGIDIEETITRADFEDWIAEDVARIAETVDEALAKAGLTECQIDKVFLTGGTSFIPAIWKVFGERFGEDKLMTGDQFESITYGLALIGRAERPEDWAMRN
ncbi:Hsp70 family protein [Nordella sp. HKS 07]|uniref:Hsp70 family protein n=1 Tax=Nordella sp. HKS 07 TaxID=2712222 RepID=UPI00352E3539